MQGAADADLVARVTLIRRAVKRDASEAAIVEALEAAGAWVWRISLPLDLIVFYNHRILLLEVKNPDSKPRKDRAKQTEMIAKCQRDGFPVYVVRTPEEALQAIGAKH